MTRKQSGCLAVLSARVGRAWWLSALVLFTAATTLKAAQSGDFTYTYSYYGATITGYTGAGGKVDIPSSLEGEKVTCIGEGAFWACTTLTGVTIPGSVTSIRQYAFLGCFRLTSVMIPGSVTSIGGEVFKACSNLTSVTISANIAKKNYSVEKGAFSDCPSLTKVYFLGNYPSGNVDSDVFSGTTNVTVFYQPQKTGWSSTFAGRPAVQLPFNYIVTVDGKASFCGFGSANSGALTIPNEAGGYPVTDIGSQAFAGCVGLTSITIPTNVTSIGVGAFFGCAGLTSITIPGNVTNIESYAFADCVGLRSVTMGHSLISIGTGAFSGCLGLTGITIPASAASIGDQAFDACSGLRSITGLGGVASIGGGAFSGCGGLAGMTIPDSVTHIGWWAFSDCTGLTEVSIPGNVAIIGDYTFSGCADLMDISVAGANANYSSLDGVLFNKDKTALIRCPGGLKGDYTVPAGVAAVESEAFSGCAGLASVTIPSSVTSIGGYAFEDCARLTAIHVDPACANYCSPEGVLFDNPITTLIHYPSGKAGSSYAVPPSVSNIGDGAFKGCAGLTEVAIPAGVASIGDNAFLNCAGLTAINVDPANANYSSVDGVLFSGDQRTLIQCPGGKTGSYEIPGSVQNIDDCAFFNCTGLTGVSISDNVTSIGDYAFFNCTGLTNITLPSIPYSFIGNFAFFNCTGLTSVTIPPGVGSIGDSAFLNCSGLTAIDVDPDNWSFSSADGVLFDRNQTTLIQCPGGKTGSYTVPAGVTRIEDNSFFNCAGLTAIDVDENNGVYSSAGGVLCNKSQTTLIQCPGGKAGSYFVPSSVVDIKGAAFINCSLLTGVAIPANVTSVGDYAFSTCISLSEITVDVGNANYRSQDGVLFSKDMSSLVQYPGGKTGGSCTVSAGITRIGGGAFSGCADLTGVYFKGNKPGCVGLGVFSGADSVTVYYLPGTVGWGEPFFADRPAVLLPYLYEVVGGGISLFAYAGSNAVEVIPSFIEGKPVTAIESYAFFNCTSLTSVTIPAGVTSIGDGAFENCTSLASIALPDGVVFIGDAAFFNCAGLTVVTLPDSVTGVGNWAFASCDTLTGMTIPAGVTHIGNYAFGYCEDLTGIYFKGDAPGFGWAVFTGSGGAAIYYLPGAAGWSQPVAGRTPVLWNPHVQVGSGFGFSGAGQFGFTVLGTNNMAVAVEACTNLASAVWSPVSTVTLANGVADFSDAASAHHPARYYRFRMP